MIFRAWNTTDSTTHQNGLALGLDHSTNEMYQGECLSNHLVVDTNKGVYLHTSVEYVIVRSPFTFSIFISLRCLAKVGSGHRKRATQCWKLALWH